MDDWERIREIMNQPQVVSAIHKIEQLLGVPPPEPPPITCCGEWTWKQSGGPGCWSNPKAHHHVAVSTMPYIMVCKKCHRALLADGKMTGPLVDSQVIESCQHPGAHEAMRNYSSLLDGMITVALRKTWGESKTDSTLGGE